MIFLNELKSSFNLSGIIVFPFNINVWWLTDLSGEVKPLVTNILLCQFIISFTTDQ